MAIRTECPRCGRFSEVSEYLRGRELKCPQCQHAFTIGGAAASTTQPIAAVRAAQKEGYSTLWAIAGLQFFCGAAMLFLAASGSNAIPPAMWSAAIIEWLGITAVFCGLAIWARVQPLPAIMVGLTLYVMLSALTVLANPTRAVAGLAVKGIIIIALFRALQTCLQGPAAVAAQAQPMTASVNDRPA